MKCQKCGADIPEGKIYCEKCGTAIQMVPDYNPADDIAIGEEEKRIKNRIPEEKAETEKELPFWKQQWKYWTAAAALIIVGITVYQISYHLILNPKDEVVAENPEVLLLEKPVLSVEPGVYDYTLRLILTHDERPDGMIYYTTDGMTPTENSKKYDRPIEIGEGETVIRAIFIRSDGVHSEEATGTYEVIFDYPDEPVFSVEAGDYAAPFYVELFAESDCQIYYTTNGAEPGPDSKLYREPIYVGPGLTVLQAVSIDAEGGASGIMEAIYNVPQNSMESMTLEP